MTTEKSPALEAALRGVDVDYFDWAWPEGKDQIAAWRRLARAGLAVETTGLCEGCRRHRRGTPVPVFRLLVPEQEVR